MARRYSRIASALTENCIAACLDAGIPFLRQNLAPAGRAGKQDTHCGGVEPMQAGFAQRLR